MQSVCTSYRSLYGKKKFGSYNTVQGRSSVISPLAKKKSCFLIESVGQMQTPPQQTPSPKETQEQKKPEKEKVTVS